MSRYTYEGPRWYRTRIRARGPFVALIPPLIVGAVALLLLNLGNRASTGLSGLFLGVCAAGSVAHVPPRLGIQAPVNSGRRPRREECEQMASAIWGPRQPGIV